MFDSSSNHNFIPSPQCALGTTPHLSIRKRAKQEIRMAKKRQRYVGKGRKGNNVEERTEDESNGGRIEKGEKQRNNTSFTTQE